MQKHDIGQAMKKTLACLVKDAHSSLGSNVFSRFQNIVTDGDIAAIRGYNFPDSLSASPYIVKWTAQLEGWLKRFRFADDVYTQEELEAQTIEKFLSTQSRLPAARPESLSCYVILQGARKIVKEVLGKYDSEVHMKYCRFGSKAAKGVSLQNSYLDLRIQKLSGSPGHVKWFKQTYLPGDKILEQALFGGPKHKRSRYVTCEALDLFNVPKSWKSLRSIMPNTVIGNFHSNGLGDYLFEKIKDSLFDLSRMQEKHKDLARRASIDKKHVTADMTSASDSYTSWLVNMLVPRDWLGALKQGRITVCEIGGTSVKLQSFMTMGIGFTFPLQTLLFYSIIKSVGRALNVTGTYSVYGDDLIYPRKIHRYVVAIFEKLGFLINKEKTFVTTNFRESCGGDYFMGVDVRPCSPSGEHRRVGRQEYCSFLYKLANGLLRRWDYTEIPSTMYFLIREIVATGDVILQVPPNFPDGAGLRVDCPIKAIPGSSMPNYYSPVSWNHSKQAFNFFYLASVPDSRVILRQNMYMWDVLRPYREFEENLHDRGNVTSSRYPLQLFVEKFLRIARKSEYVRPTRERIVWKETLPKRLRHSTVDGHRKTKTIPTVAKLLCVHLVKQTGQSSSWSKI